MFSRRVSCSVVIFVRKNRVTVYTVVCGECAGQHCRRHPRRRRLLILAVTVTPCQPARRRHSRRSRSPSRRWVGVLTQIKRCAVGAAVEACKRRISKHLKTSRGVASVFSGCRSGGCPKLRNVQCSTNVHVTFRQGSPSVCFLTSC